MLVVGTSRVIERVRRYCVGIGRPAGNVDVLGFALSFVTKDMILLVSFSMERSLWMARQVRFEGR